MDAARAAGAGARGSAACVSGLPSGSERVPSAYPGAPTEADGTRRVIMRGGLDCATEVGQAEVKIGSRTAVEHATYKIEAVDGGIGGGAAGDTFAFTVYFDPQEAPVNYAIFGPEFTFTGEMIAGEVTIVDPQAP